MYFRFVKQGLKINIAGPNIPVPVGKCSLIAQLSTCRVALPPFLVKRTTWYFPSFTGVLLSSTPISTVPMLNVTPIFPCCWNEHNEKGRFKVVFYESVWWVGEQGKSETSQIYIKPRPNVHTVWTYYMQHHVVAQARSTVNPDQDAILQGGTEANSQAVRPGARPLIGWPVECN